MNTAVPLQLDEVSFRYPQAGAPLLEAASLRCQPGRIYGLFGGNGCGKTTLLNLISGLQRPDAGRVLYYGQELARHNALSCASYGRGLTRTFQVPVVVGELTVRQNLRLAVREPGERFRALLLPVPQSSQIEQKIGECLSEFRLEHVADRPGAELSYGMRRTISNLRAIMTEARMVLMDEPFANLEPVQYQVLSRNIRYQAQEFGRTFLVVEHPPTHLAQIADEIFFLNKGRLTEHRLEGSEEQRLRTVVDLLCEAS